MNSEDAPIENFWGIFIGEWHDFKIISNLDCWLDSSVHRLTIDLSFKNVLVWTEFEPLWIPWIVFLYNIPVDLASCKVAHHQSFMVVHQVHFSGNVHEEEIVGVPYPELVRVTFDVFLEIALKGWEKLEIFRSQTLIILACEDKILSTHLFGNVKTHLTMSLHTNFLWLWWLGSLDWILVTVKYFNLVLDICVEWKWQSTL